MITPTTMKPSEIKVRKGHNVRANGDDPDFKESIATLGVLVPLIVEQDGDDVYLVAGHRRLEASIAAKLDEVPVSFNAEGDESRRDAVAAAENISRAQLNVVEEAMAVKRLLDRGLTDEGIKSTLGVSARWVTERRAILDLPEKVHPYIAGGYVSSRDIHLLVRMGEASKQLLDTVVAHEIKETDAELKQDDSAGPWRLDGWGIQGAIEATPKARRSFYTTDRGKVEDEVKKSLSKEAKAKLAELEKANYGYYYVSLTEEAIDSARAAGVLFESDPEDRIGAIVLDRAFYVQMVGDSIMAAEVGKRPSGSSTGAARKGDDPKAAERRKIREQIKELQATARDHNAKLGVNLLNGLASVELTADVATWLASSLVRNDRASNHYTYDPPRVYDAVELALGGLRYVMPEYQRIEEKGKAKRQITVYDGPKDDAGKKAAKFLAGGKEPGEKIGRLLIAVAACEYAIDRVLPRSQRHPSRNLGDSKALARIVKPHLPRGLEATTKKLRAAEQKLSELQRG